MESDHSPHHFGVSFFSLTTDFQIWRPAFIDLILAVHDILCHNYMSEIKNRISKKLI